MPLKIEKSDIFKSNAQTLVNPVNCKGVMGAGLAKKMSEVYTIQCTEFNEYCKEHEVLPGNLYLSAGINSYHVSRIDPHDKPVIWHVSDKWILHFPTKNDWRLPSTLDIIRSGLITFQRSYNFLKIESISFPLLGCGCGGLDKRNVLPLMEEYLSDLPIPVTIHVL